MGKLVTVLFILLSFGLAIFVLSLLSTKSPTIDASKTILYFGNTCPHCQDLAKYIEENKIKDNISFEEKEVYDNRNNSLELSLVAKSCGLDQTKVGVPFLYAEGKCFVGIDEAKEYFKTKSNLP